ncbi:MAG: lysophospholipid acyltransferase family protein [Alphaproteobacteria bacterium]|nr:lysophospholipid acyltransferase family protein [Alphaproteobacteria bacterium]
MITFLMFIFLWIATAKDLRAVMSLRLVFAVFLVMTAIFDIDRFFLFFPLVVFFVFAVYAIFVPQRKYPVEKNRTWKKKWISHPAESLAYHATVWFFKLLPLSWLSWLSGKLLEIVGPFTKAHKIAQRNLEIIMPQNNNRDFLNKMWNNWGRTFGEGLKFDTYKKYMHRYISFKNQHLFDDINGANQPYLVSVPHSGNMGVTTLSFLGFDAPVGITYRFPNNPLMNDVMLDNYGQKLVKEVQFIPVGNPVQLFRILHQGGVININSDQRVKEGESLFFFGRPAMTSTGVARIALKLDIPILIAHIHRIGGVRHEIVFDEILKLPKTGDARADEINGMQLVNDALERAARQSPSEYLWMHRRWGRI